MVKYKRKIIISGGVVEVYEYERDIVRGHTVTGNAHGRQSEADETQKLANRITVKNRARAEIRRIVNSNVYRYFDDEEKIITPKFVTLTFGDNITDVQEANKQFTLFIKRLNYYIGSKKSVLKYVTVIEFQDRGAVHYHMVFFNLPYIHKPELMAIWGNGFVNVNMIDDCDNVGAYLTKYMTKNCIDKRLVEQKCYFSSRNLYQPLEYIADEQVDLVQRYCNEDNKIQETEYTSEYGGRAKYTQWNLNKNSDI